MKVRGTAEKSREEEEPRLKHATTTSLQVCLRNEGSGLGGGYGYWAAGPQTADENGRRDEKGDDEEGLGLGVTPKTCPRRTLAGPSRNFKGLSMQQVMLLCVQVRTQCMYGCTQQTGTAAANPFPASKMVWEPSEGWVNGRIMSITISQSC
ncbi:hypothetical protein TWF569_001044 [Orbilia oligospora]|uniref:Uncharacterized protein n=1 Tax=Orbilia oligospora TaxID=2813651 RepID=A0A7C8NAE6_ORBOL|nr:hypothetical protein TWF102_010891 [Orbilia oligospora]KAF3093121.1 hypothetical protein TWF103_011079 [Orbilia oligospora]KAF3102202.1 hypothetical protein TWF706_005352 [Orbilia oligospora]KAF3125276.1 hypothetical protein TWF569_001044 [Orbilia oligospora]KAF3135855.1 hypothetical protein TWF594_008062 [Orbilia oligospora]